MLVTFREHAAPDLCIFHLSSNKGCRKARRGQAAGLLDFYSKSRVYSAVRIPHNPMVFKMLILLGFFADGTRSFIHSDIHRSVVHVEDYPVHNLWLLARRCARCARIFCAKSGAMCCRAGKKHAIFDRLELELSVCFHLVAAISNRSGTD